MDALTIEVYKALEILRDDVDYFMDIIVEEPEWLEDGPHTIDWCQGHIEGFEIMIADLKEALAPIINPVLFRKFGRIS